MNYQTKLAVHAFTKALEHSAVLQATTDAQATLDDDIEVQTVVDGIAERIGGQFGLSGDALYAALAEWACDNVCKQLEHKNRVSALHAVFIAAAPEYANGSLAMAAALARIHDVFGKSPVIERRLCRRSGAEGPKWDPYGWDERTVILNGVDYTLRQGGLGYSRLQINGRTVMEAFEQLPARQSLAPAKPPERTEAEVVARWEELAGMSVEQFERAYQKTHPYFDDPMGSPRDYE